MLEFIYKEKQNKQTDKNKTLDIKFQLIQTGSTRDKIEKGISQL